MGRPALPDIAIGGQRERLRVFLLEDNDANAMVIEAYLDALDHPPPVVARSIEEARSHLPDLVEGRYDMVICDLMLPDGESFEFIAELRAGQVPNLAIYSALGDGAHGECAGLAILRKPLGFQTFRKVSGL